MERALRRWSGTLQESLNDEHSAILLKKLGRNYVIHGTLLLLPPGSLDGIECQRIFKANNDKSRSELCILIAKELKITHIAINRPIPLTTTIASQDNILRAPTNFEPVHGDFGPDSASIPATSTDFEQAYWTTAKQNGILQTWAPRWTMFSRGNISEKARLLDLHSVRQAVADGKEDGRGCSVVDLYAGIGYFTFSYLRAGFTKALCWELNEWSCEGLRRGAEHNKWQTITIDGVERDFHSAAGPQEVVIFNETNEMALQRLTSLRPQIPPVRHINCGLLPSSKLSWPIAFAALDPEQAGWIHVHENFGVNEIESRADEVRAVFQSYLQEEEDNKRVAVLESIVRVKTYAPGVYHCVLDIRIPALPQS